MLLNKCFAKHVLHSSCYLASVRDALNCNNSKTKSKQESFRVYTKLDCFCD